MEKKFIGAGLLAGLVAGIVAYVFARIFIEPQVTRAIDYEGGRSDAEATLAGTHEHEHELFTRGIQENIGAGTGTLVFAVAMGAFLAVAFTLTWAYVGRRYPATDPRVAAAGVTLVGFIAVVGVPFFVYPPNPPAVGDSETIGERSGAYLTITLVALAAAVLAAVAAYWLRPRIGGLPAAVAAAVGYLAVITVVASLLPEFHEIPDPVTNDAGQIVYPGFPAEVIGLFRTYTIANQVILWTVLGLVFAVLIWLMSRRSEATDRDRSAAAVS
ncbi:CbtA family protein [Gordonia sp. TBRC 11910]|uniref:CbtA family protein n=1 Tax=Gordonia asplenii TaxID=2725283 RepID=A0A848KRN9_9ACTN|nr:CbtA family protein [Gordonia asplenii]NMO01080.1 CbtA family protein [Gordonia asplenii]